MRQDQLDTDRWRSKCHDAPVKFNDPAPDFIGDKEPLIGTVYYVCTQCGEACDAYKLQLP